MKYLGYDGRIACLFVIVVPSVSAGDRGPRRFRFQSLLDDLCVVDVVHAARVVGRGRAQDRIGWLRNAQFTSVTRDKVAIWVQKWPLSLQSNGDISVNRPLTWAFQNELIRHWNVNDRSFSSEKSRWQFFWLAEVWLGPAASKERTSMPRNESFPAANFYDRI